MRYVQPDYVVHGATVPTVGSTQGRAHCTPFGTHIAGIIGGRAYGVTKAVNIVPVRVLDCAGRGSSASVLAGLDWILTHSPTSPRVANLGFTSPASDTAIASGVQNLIDAGITVIAMTGDGSGPGGTGMNACTQTPANVPGAITVAASTSSDQAAKYTNFGPCVDLYAPRGSDHLRCPGQG